MHVRRVVAQISFYNGFYNTWMFYQIFLLPQVKRCAIITHKYVMYKLLYELSNDLRHRIDNLVSSRPAKVKILLIQAKNSFK